MFTGIVERVARVEGVQQDTLGSVLTIETGFGDLQLGESVAVNGVCLTVIELATGRPSLARFFVSIATLGLTNLGRIRRDSEVNLERALTLSTRLSGHLVQGHVDGVGEFLGAREIVSATGTSYEVRFSLPKSLDRYCVHKGSIAINGTSLTINRLDPEGSERSVVTIMLIPHTWAHTNLSRLKPGELVNIEVDLMAKYAEKLLCRT